MSIKSIRTALLLPAIGIAELTYHLGSFTLELIACAATWLVLCAVAELVVPRERALASFASTYALGQVAKRYYAGGRTLSTQMLKDSYANVMQEGKQLQAQYLPAIQEKARTLDTAKILAMVRGA